MRKIVLVNLLILGCFSSKSDNRGALTRNRASFDILHYGIRLTVNPDKRTISGVNAITFRVLQTLHEVQLDLSPLMRVDSILYHGSQCRYTRDSLALWVILPKEVNNQQTERIQVYFSGSPRIAVKPPWDGGFVWAQDSTGQPWVGLACEGIGPSVWLPCKDHWSDEADSMDMALIVPEGLTGVSNGVLTHDRAVSNGMHEFDWSVRNPINTYSISVNVGAFAHLEDKYQSPYTGQQVSLSYYVLRDNLNTASRHFAQVHRMMTCFEHYFGPYPFANDGYKLVETPYWGMEHQSCVAYGNHYQNNAYDFDFIIIHESGHEWFANSITADDPADMWIHESFTTYSEALYVEFTKGIATSQRYLNEQRQKIGYHAPMVGPRGLYYHGFPDNDIYYKGTWMLHTMRHILSNDTLWFRSLKGFYQRFSHRIISTADVISYFNEATQINWTAFFRQYLYGTKIPILQYKITTDREGKLIVRYRWKNAISGFEIPVEMTVTKGKWDIVTPTKGWQLLDLNYFDEADFKINTDKLLIVTERLTN